jgi:hypothetical protein
VQKEEFEDVLAMLNSSMTRIANTWSQPTSKFQFSMVATRVDDACQFKEEDLKPNLEFPFTLLAKMCWSKNVIEE